MVDVTNFAQMLLPFVLLGQGIWFLIPDLILGSLILGDKNAIRQKMSIFSERK